MNNFKVKLIAPPIFHFEVVYGNDLPLPFPYGLGVLTAFLRDNNYNVVLDDLSLKTENNNRMPGFSRSLKINLDILRYKKEIIDYTCGHSRNRKIERFAEEITQTAYCEGYDLIGISVITYSHFIFALLLCKKIKSMSNVKVVLGGPFITAYGKELFEQFPIVDYMVIGDGQIPLLRLIEHLEERIPIEDVPNLFYRQNGTIKANPRKLFPIEDLYMPDFSDLPLDSYRSKITLSLPYQTSRGCTHNCNFCIRRVIYPSFEPKSYNKIVTELEAMKGRYQSNSFRFYDDTINCSYEYLDKLCDIIIEKNLDISWTVAARADNLDRKILHKMRKAGCRFLSFGIESGSNRIIKMMDKSFNIEQAEKVLKDSYEEGIKNGINLMVGFPHEKEEDIIKTTEFIRKNSGYIDSILSVNLLQAEYGASLYANPKDFGIENLRPIFDVSRRLEFRYLAFDEIDGLRWKEKVKQQGYSRKKILEADFKYILSKKYHLTFIPFWLYFWLRNRLRLLYVDWIFRLFKLFSPQLYRKRP